ncbi:hypothetical protein HFN_1730 [Helicobacter fennelliae MRY12-0050]|uniref:Uncharacterized protein n=1 Tax=Helicobacter fennelliae MRY12-0050 TaxID=1325130 RepID=T1DV10_9HELI|nr:hypothetical protein HFN_1730 [Helicobacter fennelliae MRY12-0050]
MTKNCLFCMININKTLYLSLFYGGLESFFYFIFTTNGWRIK